MIRIFLLLSLLLVANAPAAFEKYIVPDAGVAKMPVHAFVAILSEYLKGEKSGAECKTAIETIVGASLTANETSDITAVLAYIDNGADAAAKARRMNEVYWVCMLAEGGVWYDTQAALRTRLSWSSP